jgi:cardiolipin synthase
VRFVFASIIVAALAAVGWRILKVNWHTTYPPRDGLSPGGARALAVRLAKANRVDSTDLDVDFSPSRASLDLFVDGEAFFPRILRDIEAAQSSVHICEFEFRPGVIASIFQSLLKAKARQGVEVRLIVDRLGSFAPWRSNHMLDDLAGAGIQVVANDAVLLDRDGLLGSERGTAWRFDEVGHADHRKLFVIDGRIAWVGSAGIADHFSDGRFHDVFVRLEGEALSYLQTVFLSSFRFYGGPLPTTATAFDRYYPTPAAPGNVRITVLHNVPREGHLATTDAIADLINNAVRRVEIICPYTADRRMIQRILDAARRGVQVRFVAPANSRNWATAGAFSHYVAQLQDAGVEVWLHPVFPHAKAVLADDRVLIGSTNLDAWALYRNWEIGILVEDATFADRVRRELFDVDISRSQLADPSSNAIVRGKDWLLAAIGPLI